MKMEIYIRVILKEEKLREEVFSIGEMGKYMKGNFMRD